MGTKGNVNVSIWVPDASVTTMATLANEVNAAAAAAKDAYLPVDADGDVPVKTYDEDFDNAIAAATDYAAKTDGSDLLVVVTNLVCDDPARAERLLAELPANGDFVVIVPVGDFDGAWAAFLDDDSPAADHIDVVDVGGLADEATAYAEVGAWAANAA